MRFGPFSFHFPVINHPADIIIDGNRGMRWPCPGEHFLWGMEAILMNLMCPEDP